MPRYPSRRLWFGIVAGASILAVGGVWVARSLRPIDPVEQGLSAYARGDWEVAAERARERLKSSGDDVVALRLLARASVRLGRDSSALALFNRLGADAMSADDLCLLGIALTRTGNPRGLEVWEQALKAEPSHPEVLFEVTRDVLQTRPVRRGGRDRPAPGGVSRLGRPGRGDPRVDPTGPRRS